VRAHYEQRRAHSSFPQAEAVSFVVDVNVFKTERRKFLTQIFRARPLTKRSRRNRANSNLLFCYFIEMRINERKRPLHLRKAE
jgi:hypothetical protein